MLRLKHCHDLHLYNKFYSSTDDPAYEFKHYEQKRFYRKLLHKKYLRIITLL